MLLGKKFHSEELVKILPELKKTFENILSDIRPADIVDTDLVRLYLTHKDLDVPITIAPTQWGKFSPETIIDKLEYVLSSKQSLKVDSSFELHMATIYVPTGSGRTGILELTGHASCLSRKSSIVQITNSDNMCLARAIVVAKAKQENHAKYDLIRKSSNPWQHVFAKNLQTSAGFPYNVGVSLNDVFKFEKVCERQIVIYSATI